MAKQYGAVRQPDEETNGHLDQSYKKKVRPKSENQKKLFEAFQDHPLVIALGPAGTGKTYLSITAAVEALQEGTVGKIVLTRPAIEAGEALGFLPGDLHEKMDPYLRPLYDALLDRIGGKQLRAKLADESIEIAPIAYMRGRTLNNAFIVIDEAQNCTFIQLKMLITRLGHNSVMVLNGDPEQTDLAEGMSGLGLIADRLRCLEEIAVIDFDDSDIVRHPLIGKVLLVLG